MLLTIEGRSAPRDKQETTMTKKMMLKTVLTFAALTLAQLSTAHAGGGYPGSNKAAIAAGPHPAENSRAVPRTHARRGPPYAVN